MFRKINILLLVLSLLEGIAALIFTFTIPSMEKNAVFFGFSLSRVMMGLGILPILIFLSWLLLRISISETWFHEHLAILKRYFEKDGRLLTCVVSLLLVSLLGLLSIRLFSNAAAAARLEMITVVYRRAFPMVLYIVALCLQSLVFLVVNFLQLFKSPEQFDGSVVFNTITVNLIIAATVFNWLVLMLKVNLYNQIPYWYWKFWPKEFRPETVLCFLAILLVTVLVLRLINRDTGNTWRNLTMLVLLGVFVQASFGFLEGEGFESLRLKFVKAGHNAYAQNASFQPDIMDSMRNYEEIYGEEMYLDTKPPGLLLFNLVVQRISNSVDGVDGFDERYERLSTFMAYVFPFLSFLTLIFIFHFSKSFLSIEDAYLSCLLYIFLPNVVLMVLELDQVLFPILFIAGMLLWKIAKDRQSVLLALLTGCFCYFCVFITYSLLPMIGLMVFWYVLEFFLYPQKQWNDAVKMALGLIAGLLLSMVIYELLFDYDVILRYKNSMIRHQFHKQFNSGGNTQAQMLLLNNLEFAVWSGFPLAILYVSRTIKAFVSLLQKKFSKIDLFSLAMFLMYFILNFVGHTRSEVGRLWIFMLPAMVIIAMDEIGNIIKNKKLGMMFFIILQLITIFITYQYQDAINL